MVVRGLSDLIGFFIHFILYLYFRLVFYIFIKFNARINKDTVIISIKIIIIIIIIIIITITITT